MKEFDKIFGINKSKEEAEREFINRVENTIFQHFPEPTYPNQFGYATYFKDVCTELGLKANDFPSLSTRRYQDLSVLTKGNFLNTLRMISALYKVYSNKAPHFVIYINKKVDEILEMSSIKLGIRWHQGMFFPDPIPEIDQYLIDENLQFLNAFPAAKKDIQFALKNYQEKSTTGILDKCYSALEQVAQKLCDSKKPLHREDFIKEIITRINASSKWKEFLESFIQYANDTRHGKDPNRHDLDPDEIESYLFLSLIMIRMIIKKIPTK
jgi:hypothetical protein